MVTDLKLECTVVNAVKMAFWVECWKKMCLYFQLVQYEGVLNQVMLLFYIFFVVIVGWIFSEGTESSYYLEKKYTENAGKRRKEGTVEQTWI